MHLAVFATQGSESRDAQRARDLLGDLPGEVWPFDRRRKIHSAIEIFQRVIRLKPDLVLMEGTGVAGGLPLMAARVLRRGSYVVSTGDAVAPFVGMMMPVAWPFALLYERALYSLAAGVVGWSPYLTGRALTLGAKRAMTAENWSRLEPDGNGRDVRRRLGIGDDAIVVGVVGSLTWSRRRRYCYGLELVQAVRALHRADVVALIVGDGTGLPRLRRCADAALGDRVFLPGAVPSEDLHHYLAAMDIAVLAQSVDRVGSFRFTAKLSDYARAGVPVISTRVPLAYDLGEEWMWTVPGKAPWDPNHVSALTALLEELNRRDIAARQDAVPQSLFDGPAAQNAVTHFLSDLASEAPASSP